MLNWKWNPRRPIGPAVRTTAVLVSAALVAALGACGPGEAPMMSASSSDPPVATPAPAPSAVPGVSYAETVARVAPAVVTVRSAARARAQRPSPFFPAPAPREEQGPPEYRQFALGSGVLVSADGFILTNAHVISGAERIMVDLTDGRSLEAQLVGSDPPSDLALLRVSGESLPVLTLGDSDRVRVGDVVLAIGNPLGIGQTVTSGIVSAKGRATGLSDGSFEDFLQTDAAINQGNSGGALVNVSGELIGINSQILSPSGGNIGIGFAIPTKMAESVMAQLKSSGKVRRGQLGVTVAPVTADVASKVGLPGPRGVIIAGVSPGSAADRAGLREGDVVLAFNGMAVNETNAFRNMVASTPPGTQVRLTVLRDGREVALTPTLGEYVAVRRQ
jgi:serine protease Do